MKKAQKARRDFEKLRAQLRQASHVAAHTKDSRLWDHEKAARQKLRALRLLEPCGFPDYGDVYNGWLDLLDGISARLLRSYNRQNRTHYDFDEIVQADRAGYIEAGILSVLVTSHIPKLMAREIARRFHADPSREYGQARDIKRRFILHLGETNTGKTYRAVERLRQAGSGVYLAPLRILALENYERLNDSGVPCHLVTGEEELHTPGARHVCATVEKLDLGERYDVAVIDEVQMIADSQRGHAWTRALLGLTCPEIHVCGARSARELLLRILGDCGDEWEIVDYVRDTPLEVCAAPFSLRHVQAGDALVTFTKRRVLELSRLYRQRGTENSVIYGDLPPEVRRMQYRAFAEGKNRLLITTDAVGMGVNLPIRRIVFMELSKYDGDEKRYLTAPEVRQIAGRAGRKGMYDVGRVCTAGIDTDFIREQLDAPEEMLEQAVVGPGEALVKIPGLPLREKLALWSTQEERLGYYRKMDVRDYLIILDGIRRYRLPQDVEFKLMKLPFDVGDSALMAYFSDCVQARFVLGQKALHKPERLGEGLADMERHYKMLGLYYGFSKNFGLEFDPQWVRDARHKTSEIINRLLVKF